MATSALKGIYRQPAGDDEPVAYVTGDGEATFVTETEYRATRIEPTFETLPSQEEYEAVLEKEDTEATKDATITSEFDGKTLP